jgi:microcin C transport system substrate-binding protein
MAKLQDKMGGPGRIEMLKTLGLFAGRRASAVAACCVALLANTMSPAYAGKSHALSTFGDFKYPQSFKHFDYVNPQAPKGGRISTNGGATFDTFNHFIVKGVAATGLGLLNDSLMERSADEPDTVYGLIAHSAEIAPDRRSITFHMRPEAKFSDGSPVTAADVVFTFETLKEKAIPGISLPLRDVAKAEALDAHTVLYTFQGDRLRDLPMVVAGLPVLSKSYYATRTFEQTTLEPPLGSGPYMIASHEGGKFITYKRRTDYWGKDLSINVGRYNFDEIRFDYFRDRGIALEALKAQQIDLREEFIARDWSTAYDLSKTTHRRARKDSFSTCAAQNLLMFGCARRSISPSISNG